MNINKGYTLIEIMIALFVFAILATITSTVMYHAFDTRSRITKQADRLNDLQLTLTFISRDTEQIVERSIYGDEMTIYPAFVGLTAYVEFTRGGLVNPSGIDTRSTLKRVAFLCSGKNLIRRTWDNLDMPVRKMYRDKTLLTNLETCTFAYLGHNRQLLSEWRENAVQQNQAKETLPIAIQLNLTLHDWGNMNLLFSIPEALYAG